MPPPETSISKLRCSLERAIGSEVFLGKNLASEVDNLASEVFLAVEKRPEAGHISNPPDRDTSGQWLLPIAKSFATRNDTELQAKCVNVKCWACVNFSCVRGEELLRFLRSLVRMCVNIGMDFSVEPTMLVLDPRPTDIEDSLLNVRRFFDHREMETDQISFLLVMLPDATAADEIEDLCKDIGFVYHCLPLYGDGTTATKKYMENVVNEIKAKVMQCNGLSDSCKDLNINYKDMDSVHLCSSHNELGEYTSEEKNPDAIHISGSPNRECVQRVIQDEWFTTITDATSQAKSANRKPWACLNFSRISGQKALRFLYRLGTRCMSIGMDFSLEPTMTFHISTSCDTDVGASLWTVFKFFKDLNVGKQETLVLVILPEARSSHANVGRMCENLGFVCQFCDPRRNIFNKKYMERTANEMKAKVLQSNTPESSGDIIYIPEELYGSDEDDDSQQASEDSDAEMGIEHYSSHNVSGEHCQTSEKLTW